MPNQKRIRVDVEIALPIGMVGIATFKLVDHDDQTVCFHCFCYPKFGSAMDTPEWFNAHLKIAQAIADALNAAPAAAIEYIRQSLREATALQARIDRKTES